MARGRSDRGYAFVALLAMMAVMAIALTAILPMWSTQARREKEAELIFRGEQYARAIARFQRQYGNASPPSIDVLLNEKFLRKKYKDPITGDDFALLNPGQPIPGVDTQPPGGAGGLPQSGAPRAGLPQMAQQLQQRADQLRQTATGRPPTAVPFAGSIIGVVSKSTDTSLRLYNGRDKYNEWVFLGTAMSQRIGGPGGPAGRIGGPGQPPRGNQPPRGGPGVQNPRGGGPAPPFGGTPFGGGNPFGTPQGGQPQPPGGRK